MKLLIIPKRQRLHLWSFGIDKSFYPTLYRACDNLSVLVLKLNHISKRGPWRQPGTWRRFEHRDKNMNICDNVSLWLRGHDLLLRIPGHGDELVFSLDIQASILKKDIGWKYGSHDLSWYQVKISSYVAVSVIIKHIGGMFFKAVLVIHSPKQWQNFK